MGRLAPPTWPAHGTYDLGVPADDPLAAIDVEGPVRAEVFVVYLHDGVIELTGPCGPAPWYIETGAGEHPVEVVRRVATNAMGAPLLVHSTSWRQGPDGVILSFFLVVDAEVATAMASVPVLRSELARSEAATAPDAIATAAVLEHAVRHLAWLAQEDDVVRATLDEGWHAALREYVPEPFRNLG